MDDGGDGGDDGDDGDGDEADDDDEPNQIISRHFSFSGQFHFGFLLFSLSFSYISMYPPQAQHPGGGLAIIPTPFINQTPSVFIPSPPVPRGWCMID